MPHLEGAAEVFETPPARGSGRVGVLILELVRGDERQKLGGRRDVAVVEAELEQAPGRRAARGPGVHRRLGLGRAAAKQRGELVGFERSRRPPRHDARARLAETRGRQPQERAARERRV